MEEKEEKKKDYNITYWQMLKRFPKLYRFISKYKGLMIFLLVMNALSVVLISIPPLLVRYCIDQVIPTKDLFSLNIIFFFAKRVTGEITSRLNNDAGSVEYLASQAIFDLTRTFLQIFVSLVFLFYLSWKLTMLVLILTFMMYICVTIVMHKFKKYRKIISERWGKLLGYLQEVMGNIKLVMAFGAENKEAVNHIKKSREYIKDNIIFGVIDRLFNMIGILFYYVFQLGVIVYGVYLLHSGDVSVGLLLAFIMYITNFFDPIFGLSGTMTFVISSFVSVDRIYSYIEEKNDIVSKENAMILNNPKGNISFQDVKFRYEEGKDVLNGISLEINDGESIAFVGHSGAGKSTMINLILRFYDPVAGKILFDGIDLCDIEVNSYRDNISIVFQDALLFNDTIMNNIKYSKPEATLAELDKACKDANVYDFIMELPKKYETMIGERGLKLSGGQRQRLSIARAILKNPKILVLDEATASIDSISENIIQRALDKIMKDRTTIIIAHRLTTIINVDKIFVFDKGLIKEVGSHQQLLAKKGLYSQLWNTQMEEAEKTRQLVLEGEDNQ